MTSIFASSFYVYNYKPFRDAHPSSGILNRISCILHTAFLRYIYLFCEIYETFIILFCFHFYCTLIGIHAKIYSYIILDFGKCNSFCALALSECSSNGNEELDKDSIIPCMTVVVFRPLATCKWEQPI